MNEKPSLFIWMFVVGGLIALLLAALDIIPVSSMISINAPNVFTRILIALAVIHTAEASYAFVLAKKKNKNPWFWASQTLMLGMFSLRLIKK